jgi:hypothetical protein
MRLRLAPRLTVRLGCLVVPAVFLCCTFAGAGEATPGNDPVWESRFFGEYPSAVRKLKEATDQVRITARCRRRYSADEDPPWTDLQFMKQGNSLRLQLHSPAIAGRPAEENVGIITPDHALLAKDPGEPWRTLQYSGDRPDHSLKVFSEMYGWRFLGCTFGLSRPTTLLDDIHSGRIVVTGVTQPVDAPGWVRVSFRFREENENPQLTASGSGYALLDPKDSWCMHEACVFSGPPFNLEVHQFVDALESLPSGHMIAKRFHMLGYELQPDSSPPIRKKEQFRECVDYELQSAEESATPSSEFTAEALGFQAKAQASRNRELRLGAAGLALALFFVWRRWLRNPVHKQPAT